MKITDKDRMDFVEQRAMCLSASIVRGKTAWHLSTFDGGFDARLARAAIDAAIRAERRRKP